LESVGEGKDVLLKPPKEASLPFPSMSRRVFVKLGMAAVAGGPLPAQVSTDSAGAMSAQSQGSTLLVTHEAFLDHLTNTPERPARMKVIDAALSDQAFSALRRESAPLRDDIEAAILRVHSAEHLNRIAAAAADMEHLPYFFDRDTMISAGSWEAVRRAAGGGLLAVDRVMDSMSGIANAFCQVRPPGHHAERDRIVGFCLFDNIAIAAAYARAKHGVERVAIVDFDVHHGNGTQQIFYSDSNTFYGSTHQMPLFPGTGAATETGVGNIVNAPLRAGDDGTHFREAMTARILPALDAFRPDFIFVSAGFDAHLGDPLAGLQLLEPDFEWITEKLIDAAQKHCNGRLVSFLEGGYRLPALADSAAAHVRVLMAGA